MPIGNGYTFEELVETVGRQVTAEMSERSYRQLDPTMIDDLASGYQNLYSLGQCRSVGRPSVELPSSGRPEDGVRVSIPIEMEAKARPTSFFQLIPPEALEEPELSLSKRGDSIEFRVADSDGVKDVVSAVKSNVNLRNGIVTELNSALLSEIRTAIQERINGTEPERQASRDRLDRLSQDPGFDLVKDFDGFEPHPESTEEDNRAEGVQEYEFVTLRVIPDGKRLQDALSIVDQLERFLNRIADTPEVPDEIAELVSGEGAVLISDLKSLLQLTANTHAERQSAIRRAYASAGKAAQLGRDALTLTSKAGITVTGMANLDKALASANKLSDALTSLIG